MPDIAFRMSRDEAEQCLDEIRIGTLNIKAKLIELYEGRGWESLGYPSWRECIQAELQIGKSQAYRLLDAAYVSQEISPIGENVSESQARELAKAPQGKRAETLEKAKESAKSQGREKPTAKDIRAAVDRGSGSEPPHDATQQDAKEPRRAVMDGDQLQQGDDDGTDAECDTDDPRGALSPVFGGGSLPPKSQHTTGAVAYSKGESSACLRGGHHSPKRESGETFCQKCFEPLDESDDAQASFDFEAVDETCQFWVDNCPLLERVKLSNALKVWAQKAKEIK